MEIIVCIKQVPETREVEVDAETGVLKREGVDSIINPYDLHALEAAVALKEQYGGRVAVISMGPPQAETIIREAYMMGADAGFLLSDRKFAGADTLATAYTLAKGIERAGKFDLILCGMQTTDGDTAQVGPGIAEFLDIPHEAYVQSIKEVEQEIKVVRDMGSSVQEVALQLPCLLTVTKKANQPRLLSYRQKIKSKDWPVTIWSCQDIVASDQGQFLGLSGSPTQVERIFPPESSTTHQRWTGNAQELTDKLYQALQERKFAWRRDSNGVTSKPRQL